MLTELKIKDTWTSLFIGDSAYEEKHISLFKQLDEYYKNEFRKEGIKIDEFDLYYVSFRINDRWYRLKIYFWDDVIEILDLETKTLYKEYKNASNYLPTAKNIIKLIKEENICEEIFF